MANVFERVKVLTRLIPRGRAVTYGQVAALAGIPGSVSRDAKRRLRQLENREIDDGPQGDLFAAAPEPVEAEPHPALDALKNAPTRCETIENSAEAVKTYLAARAR